jgi:hypothetical protein
MTRHPGPAGPPALAVVMLLVLAGAGAAPPAAEADEADLDTLVNVPVTRRAWAPGEYLDFDISWGGVPAGESTMSVVAGKSEDGRPVIWLVSFTRSNRGVSLVYPINDRVVSQVDPVTGLPERIDIAQHHGRQDRVRTIFYDQARQRATTHWDKREPVSMDTPPQVQDIVSCLYYFRNRKDLEPGNTVAIELNDGKHNSTLMVHIERRERVVVPAGAFDTLRAWADLQFEGVFMEPGDVRLWLTDDVRHVPVRVSVKIPLGRVNADLAQMALPPLVAPPRRGAGLPAPGEPAVNLPR